MVIGAGIDAVRRGPAVAAVFACLGLLACTCGAPGRGRGGQGEPPGGAGACAAARASIEALYRAEAQARFHDDVARVEEATRDNSEMVLAECARRPEVAACARKAEDAVALERTCLTPLDDEGSEGDSLGR
ncbi:MAG: hypothetical protein R3B48_03490 [Kofleriaceae bacterium]